MRAILAALLITWAVAVQAADECLFSVGEVSGTIKISGEARAEIGTGRYSDGVFKLQTKDVKKVIARGRSEMGPLNQLTRALDIVLELELEVPWKQVESAQVTVLDSTKNRTDLGGGQILTLYDAQRNVLLRIGQLGMGAGVCQ